MLYEPSLSLHANTVSQVSMGAGNGMGLLLEEEEQDHVLFGTKKCSDNDSSCSNDNMNTSAGEDSNDTNSSSVGHASSSECNGMWELPPQGPGKIDLLEDAPLTQERVWGAVNDDDCEEEEVEDMQEVVEDDMSVQSSSTVSVSLTANMVRNLRAAGVDECLSPLDLDVDSLKSTDFSCCDLLPPRPLDYAATRGRDDRTRGRSRGRDGEGRGEEEGDGTGRAKEVGECSNGWVGGQHTETSPIEHLRPHPAADQSSATMDASELRKSIVVSLY